MWHHKGSAKTVITLAGRNDDRVISGLIRRLSGQWIERSRAISRLDCGEVIAPALDSGGQRGLSQVLGAIAPFS